MIRITRIVAGILLCAMLTSPLPAQQPLAWKYIPGKTLRYQLVQKTKTTMSLGASESQDRGGKVTTEVRQTLDMAWLVKEVQQDGTGLIELNITRIQLKVDGPGGQGLEYDSADETRPQGFAAMIAGVLKRLTEATYQVTMTSRGEITSVVLPESLLEQARDAPGGELMGDLISEAGFKNLMSQSTLLLPEQAELVPGHIWSNTTTIENAAMGGKQTVETIYLYEGIQQAKGKPLEAISMQMEFDFGNGKMPGGASIEILLQRANGKMLFNRLAGRLRSSVTKQRIQLEIENDGQTIGQTIEQTVNLRWQAE